jgi:hypothetical protein
MKQKQQHIFILLCFCRPSTSLLALPEQPADDAPSSPEAALPPEIDSLRCLSFRVAVQNLDAPALLIRIRIRSRRRRRSRSRRRSTFVFVFACRPSSALLAVEEKNEEDGFGAKQPGEVVRSLADVLAEIKRKETKREECTAKFENATSDSKEQFFAKQVDVFNVELATLREEVARFEAPSSAPSCATSVVRKYFLREGGLSVCLFRLVHAYSNRVLEGEMSSRECRA